jgi:hypothetical protein
VIKGNHIMNNYDLNCDLIQEKSDTFTDHCKGNNTAGQKKWKTRAHDSHNGDDGGETRLSQILNEVEKTI